MAFNFGPLKKVYGWICDCFTFPPRPIHSTDNTCYGISGDGENSMNGLTCTEPAVIPPSSVIAVDPPRCFGGDGPCSPMPAMFRAVFPCPVPGSTCLPNSGGGGGGGGYPEGKCCPFDLCAEFVGHSTEGCTHTPRTIRFNQLYTGICSYDYKSSIPADSDTVWATLDIHGPPEPFYRRLIIRIICDSVTISAEYRAPFGPPNPPYNQNCEGEFTLDNVINDSPDNWQPSISLVFCSTSGTGTGTGTGTFVGCQNYLVETPDNSTLSPPAPYQDCTACWILSTSGTTGTSSSHAIAGPFGGLTEDDCFQLNSGNLCYLPKDSSPGLLIWGTECTTSNPGPITPPYFGPENLDTYRRKWQLEYNTFTQDFTLHSFKKIDTPKYTLHDTNPCAGNTKTLTLVPSTGTGTSGVGCSIAPETITLTRGTNCANLCPPYNEPGCSVILSRYCNEDGYGLGSSVPVSAIPGASSLCVPERTTHHCCDVGCGYNGGTSESCATQKEDYVGRTDPWVNVGSGVRAWDFDPVAGTLTGTFIEGTIVYTVNSEGLNCNSVSLLVRTSTTLPSEIARKYPDTVCLVPDTLVTCNVRLNPTTGTGTIPGLDDSPCANAGYKHSTGHEDFCDCFDTCDPVILGSITVGNCAGAPICFARQSTIGPQHPDAKSRYTRLGCILVYDGEKFNALAQSVYCIGPGQWASDWYCMEGQVDDQLNRDFVPCSAVVGSFLGTTYATKNSCGTFPFFPFPTEPLVENKCKCAVGPCCDLPNTLHVTMTSAGISICSCLGTTTATLTYNATDNAWEASGIPVGTCGKLMGLKLSCNPSTGGWLLIVRECGNDRPLTSGPVADCTAFQLDFTYLGSTNSNCCTGSNDSGSFIHLTFTA